MGVSAARGFYSRVTPLLAAVMLASAFVVVPPPAEVRAEPVPAEPTLRILPYCYKATQPTFAVHGRSFPPNSSVTITDAGHEFQAGWTVAATVDAYGSFVTNMTIEHDGLAFSYMINAYETDGGYYTQVPLDLCSDDLHVVATPNCSDPGNPTIRVHLDRFPEYDPITVRLMKDDNFVGQPLVVESFPADVDFQPGVELGPGEYNVMGIQGDQASQIYGIDTFVVPCPVARIDPDCSRRPGVPPGLMSISISGESGWLQGTHDGQDEVRVIFDPYDPVDPTGHHPQEFVYRPADFDQAISESGQFDTFQITPFARPPGVYKIHIKQEIDVFTDERDDPLVEQTLLFNVPCGLPTLTVDPLCGPPALNGDVAKQYSLTATGREFVPDTITFVVFDPGSVNGNPPVTFQTETDGGGGFTLSMSVPYRPPGSYVVTAYQRTTAGLLEASATFVVPCFAPYPLVTIDPTCGPVTTGIPLAYLITISGAGFVPGPVAIQFDPAASLPETFTAFADDTGSFTTTVQAAGKPAGVYDIVVSQSTLLGVYDQVTVPFPVPCSGVFVRITPTSGARGFVPIVEGFNFRPLTTLLLRWDYGLTRNQPVTVTTDENGTFSHQLVVFRSDFTGLRNLTVELPTDPLAYPEVRVPYLVTATSVSPPFKLDDNPFAAPDATIVFRR